MVFVDDDPDDRDLFSESLFALGVEPFLVLDSGKSLFTYLESIKGTELPKGIVLDLNMPEMDGLEILKQLKANKTYQRTPVYILTTSNNPESRQHCLKQGAANYYVKPTTLVELNTILNEIYDEV